MIVYLAYFGKFEAVQDTPDDVTAWAKALSKQNHMEPTLLRIYKCEKRGEDIVFPTLSPATRIYI